MCEAWSKPQTECGWQEPGAGQERPVALSHSVFLPEDGRCAESLLSAGNPEINRIGSLCSSLGLHSPDWDKGRWIITAQGWGAAPA